MWLVLKVVTVWLAPVECDYRWMVIIQMSARALCADDVAVMMSCFVLLPAGSKTPKDSRR